MLWAAVPAALLPWALVRLAATRLPIRWRWAVALAAFVYGGAAAFALAYNWGDNLRFAPWAEILVAAAVAVAAALLSLKARGRLPDAPLRVSLVAVAFWLAAIGIVLPVSTLEAPRKIAGARAAFVGQTLEAARGQLDFDGDGYARALGGGDCNDRDPLIHPGALDVPGDGVDADCDGEDATDALPPPARMVDLPHTVPPNLDLLLVTIDTLRADHIGAYGYPRPTSPVIDALAAEGTLFENGWAHAPSTRYSMPAIAAGRWPSAITWDESIWWPRLGPDVRTTAQALHDAGYFTGGLFSFNYFALRRSPRLRTRHGRVPRRARGAARRGQRADGVARIVVARESPTTRSRSSTGTATRSFSSGFTTTIRTSRYETHREVPVVRAVARRPLRRRDPLHRSSPGTADRAPAGGRTVGSHRRRPHRRPRRGLRRTRHHRTRFRSLPRADEGAVHRARAGDRAPARVRVPVGHVDIAPTLVNLARGAAEPAFIGRSLIPDVAGPPAPDADTRAVFQEVTSERGKKRALATTTRHLVWNAVPGDTTECYDRVRDPAEEHDIWQRERRRVRGARALAQADGRRPRAAARGRGQAGAGGHAAGPRRAAAHAPAGRRAGRRRAGARIRRWSPARFPRVGRWTSRITSRLGKPLAAGWRLFFHLEGPAGYRNLDHVPVDGLMPIDRWRPGQVLRDRQRIPMPPGTPPGTYTLYLGAFRGAERLPVTPAALNDGSNRLRLLSFVVSPSNGGPGEGPTPPAKGSRGQSPRPPTR